MSYSHLFSGLFDWNVLLSSLTPLCSPCWSPLETTAHVKILMSDFEKYCYVLSSAHGLIFQIYLEENMNAFSKF